MVYSFVATRWIYPKGSSGIIKTRDDVIVSTVKGELYDNGLTYLEVCGRITEEFRGWNYIAVRPSTATKRIRKHDE